jgi:hypothetical protein
MTTLRLLLSPSTVVSRSREASWLAGLFAAVQESRMRSAHAEIARHRHFRPTEFELAGPRCDTDVTQFPPAEILSKHGAVISLTATTAEVAMKRFAFLTAVMAGIIGVTAIWAASTASPRMPSSLGTQIDPLSMMAHTHGLPTQRIADLSVVFVEPVGP